MQIRRVDFVRRGLAACGIWLSSCGAPSAPGDTDGPDDTANATRDDLPVGCNWRMRCPGPPVCDVTFASGSFLPPEGAIEGSPDCVIDAINGSEPVRVGVYFSTGGMLQYGDVIVVYGDGTAGRREYVVGEVTSGPYQRVEIRPAEHFEACRNSSDVTVLRTCLTDWFVPDTCVGDVCCPLPGGSDHVCP